MLSGILSGIQCGLLFATFSTLLPANFYFMLSDKLSDIVRCIFYGMLSGVCSGLLFGMWSGIFSGILYGMGSGILSGMWFGMLSTWKVWWMVFRMKSLFSVLLRQHDVITSLLNIQQIWLKRRHVCNNKDGGFYNILCTTPWLQHTNYNTLTTAYWLLHANYNTLTTIYWLLHANYNKRTTTY